VDEEADREPILSSSDRSPFPFMSSCFFALIKSDFASGSWPAACFLMGMNLGSLHPAPACASKSQDFGPVDRLGSRFFDPVGPHRN